MASLGCAGPDALPPSNTTTSGGTSDGDEGNSPTTGADAPSTTGADSTGADSTGTSSGGSSDEAGFVVGGDVPIEPCTLFDDDCPVGTKCRVVGQDGVIHGTQCGPVARDPAGIGDACVVLGEFGLDDCDVGSYCAAVDTKAGEGLCLQWCGPRDWTCEDPEAYCTAGESFGACATRCSPLISDCPDGWGCYPVHDEFVCVAVTGQAEAGQACEYLTDCAPGHGCMDPDFVGACSEEGFACCSAFCDLGDLDPPCLDGQVCDPWDDRVPGVGICALPQN